MTAAHESAAAAMCVRLVDVSGILAIHIPTRSLLRSSSTHEPSDPPLRVVLWINYAGSRPSSMDFHRLRLERLAGRRSHLGLKMLVVVVIGTQVVWSFIKLPLGDERRCYYYCCCSVRGFSRLSRNNLAAHQ